MMDTNNWRPSVGGDWRHLMDTNYWGPSVPNGGDWRTQLTPDLRLKIVDEIMETIKKHLPFCGPDELRGIAVSFEEKTFNGADNQTAYLQKISMKMLALVTKWQNTAGSSSSVIAATNGTSMDSRHLMDNNNNWRPSLPNGEATMDTCDWRTQLPPETRQKIYNTLMNFSRTLIQITGSTALPSPMLLVSSIPNNNNVTSAALLKQRLKVYRSMNTRMKARAKVPLEIGGVQLNEEYVDEDKKKMDMKNRTSEESKEASTNGVSGNGCLGKHH